MSVNSVDKEKAELIISIVNDVQEISKEEAGYVATLAQGMRISNELRKDGKAS